MKKTKKLNIITITLITVIGLGLLNGCTTPPPPAKQTQSRSAPPALAAAPTAPVVQLYRAYGVVAGLTRVDPAAYNGWSGKCPGCDIDAWCFSNILDAHDIRCTTLYNEGATSERIIAAARQAARQIRPGGLLILYISGHGGQQRDTNFDESDQKDEYLCLYDGRLSDDIIWKLLNQVPPSIRIFFVTDTCHSGTNFRGPASIARAINRADTTPSAHTPDMLHFGGSDDAHYSYGSEQGGVFTTALVDTWEPGITYGAWFRAAVKLMPSNQIPTIESTGVPFFDRPIFR